MGAPQTSAQTDTPIRELLRSVNEHVTRLGGRHSDVIDEFDYVCECTDAKCAQPVRLSLDAYARISETPGWYVVVPGHVRPEEDVVEQGRRHVVVMRREH